MSPSFATANWMYAPGTLTCNRITHSDGDTPIANKEPTHTAQQVLEMAEMTEKRKVRKDFDPKRAYSVDVSNCTEDEKKEVQQAFFDAGFLWRLKGKEYLHLGVEQYSNIYSDGTTSDYCLFGEIKEDSITPAEFLKLVYEPEQQGHPHAHLMTQYAEDAKFTAHPWRLWQYRIGSSEWTTCISHPDWGTTSEYRRKPKIKLIHGVEISDISFIPEQGENYYYPDIDNPSMYNWDFYFRDAHINKMHVKGNRCYPYTDEGKQVAIRHSKALLGLAN